MPKSILRQRSKSEPTRRLRRTVSFRNDLNMVTQQTPPTQPFPLRSTFEDLNIEDIEDLNIEDPEDSFKTPVRTNYVNMETRTRCLKTRKLKELIRHLRRVAKKEYDTIQREKRGSRRARRMLDLAREK